MRVLHIVTHLGGGVGKAVSGLILGCNDVNIEHEVIMLEIPQNKIYVNELKKKGIKVNICNKLREIVDIIEKFDVVVVSWWNHPAMLKLFLDISFIKARLILWCHVNGCAYPFLNYKFTMLFDKVFFTSEYSYENSLWTNNQRKEIIEKSEVILGMGDFKPELIKSKESYVCNEIFTIGYIGTVNFSKMNKHFFEFCREVILQYNNIKILIVGDYDKECIHAAKEMGIYEHCEFTGQVNNVYEYMSKMDVVAYLLSKNNYATTENVLIECMAYGMPIIIMNNKPERYIIRDKKSGFVVNNGPT